MSVSMLAGRFRCPRASLLQSEAFKPPSFQTEPPSIRCQLPSIQTELPSIRGELPFIEVKVKPSGDGHGHDAPSGGNHCCSVVFRSAKAWSVQVLKPTDWLSWR
jgi:hypothetical protein